MARTSTFSEFWYRVAEQHICLRPQVRIRRQHYRGALWHVLEDPFGNQFYRVRPEAYRFLARLSPRKTVDQVWRECLEADPDNAPGQEEVIQLLAQLYFANLLHYEMAADSEKFFERYTRRRQREKQFTLMNVMFARFPLFDPDAFLKRAMPLARILFNKATLALWIAVMVWAIKVAVDHAGELWTQGQSVLSLSNLPLLYAGLVIVKTLHEFGHAFACKRFGGEVHTMGIMLLIFNPLPYIDTTSSWSFRERGRRFLVDASGMMVELFIAACCVFVWASVGPGVVRSLAYNIMFVASVSSIVFNGNPLLRYDGYYMLSDLLNVPNLAARATQQLRHLAERYLFGVRRSTGSAETRREAVLLVTYGILSGLYRIVVFSGIILMIGSRFLLAGVIMAAFCVVTWITVPIGRFLHYLATSPRLDRCRPRAAAVSAALAAVALLLLAVIPFPSSFHAPGIVRARRYSQIAARQSGFVRAALATSGARVEADAPLIEQADPEMAFSRRMTEAEFEGASAARRRALLDAAADLRPIEERMAVIGRRLEHLDARRRDLTVHAPHAGVWVAPDLPDLVGMWVPRGALLGELVDTAAFEFAAIVPQQQADRLFAKNIRGARVRLPGRATRPLRVRDWNILPAEQDTLPTAALGWRGGGDVALAADDDKGTHTAEPFFEVRATLDPEPDVALMHGLTGRIRFRLPPEPLLRQWGRALRQLVQKRYQL